MASVGKTYIYAVVGGLLVTDLLWSAHIGLLIEGWLRPTSALCVMVVLSLGYRRRSRIIADMAESAALWISFTAAGCLLTYLCAASALPLQDAALTKIDHAIGFDWLVWRNTVLAWPVLHWALFLAYASLMPQIVFSILFFPIVGMSERNIELLLLAALTLLPTALISALSPVLGPFATFGGDEATFLPDLLALRAGGPWHFNLTAMQGIIQMPSYHMVLAILFTYAFRGTGRVGWGIAGLNALMLLSIPPIGGHYLVDMIGGGAIALLCILGLRWLFQLQALQASILAYEHH
jgi:membrane-associated phospholipid phosphatase